MSALNDFLDIVKSRSFWMFCGSGLIVSVAYMDPGNWGTSISSGAAFNYDLLWAIWAASGMAMLFQYLSGKLGIAGYSLPELIKLRWRNKHAVLAYWLLAELAVLATDLAEFLGIVVALNLLFGIPMLMGTFIAMFDVLLLLFLTNKTFRKLEYAFIAFVGVIGLGYVYELFLTKPDAGAIAFHSLNPVLTQQTLLLVVGIIGATVMPHALFVHSWLLKNKLGSDNSNNGGNGLDRKTALKYHLVENVASLILAAFINAAILIMSASAFYASGVAVASIADAYKTLTPLFGTLASVVFGVALLSAGISSSITGVLSGQCIMDALTEFRLSPIARRLITRVINVIPLLVVILLNIEPLDILVYSQVALSLLIPLPMIPLIYYTARKDVMGEFANRRLTTLVAAIFGAIIVALNIYLVFQWVFGV